MKYSIEIVVTETKIVTVLAESQEEAKIKIMNEIILSDGRLELIQIKFLNQK